MYLSAFIYRSIRNIIFNYRNVSLEYLLEVNAPKFQDCGSCYVPACRNYTIYTSDLQFDSY